MLPEAPATAQSRSDYRPDIDGLRAIAVLLVVAAHLHVRGLAGGYIGVDVFFVISGYLISAHIMPRIAAGTFSLQGFYERRLRRIFPALVVMIAATILPAWHFLLPHDLVAYARSAVAGVFAYANLLPLGVFGYFDRDSDLRPLLHLWSLGVEEQFYLVFPLLLMLLARWRSRRLVQTAIWLLALASFAAACWTEPRSREAAFFLPHLRMWELLVGVVLSQRYVPTLRAAWQRHAASLLGLALILAAALLYTDRTQFPGVTALAPCLGAALLIASSETGVSIGGWLLGLRPLVWVGLMSYSVYLWHWPVMVFYRYYYLQACGPESCALPPSLRRQAALFALSLLLGWLSWRFVETPFRFGTHRPSAKALGVFSAVAAALVIAIAGRMIFSQGEPQRFSPAALRLVDQLAIFPQNRWGSCAIAGLSPHSAEAYDRQRCLPHAPGKTHYLLLGDSHAAHLWPGLSTVFPELDLGQLNVSGCNLTPVALSSPLPGCRDLGKYLYRDLLPSGQIDALIVAADWRPGQIDEVQQLIDDAHARKLPVILIGPTPDYDMAVPRLLSMLAPLGSKRGTLGDHEFAFGRQTDARMALLARDRWHVPYISYFDNICGTAPECPGYAAPGIAMLYDEDHLTEAGSVRFAQTMRARHQLP
jgi:peptidoglycan/LPS O-acetylase OafA/YrhL